MCQSVIMLQAGFTAGGFTHTKIYTKDTSGHHYNKYMTTHGYPQDAHTYTTEKYVVSIDNGAPSSCCHGCSSDWKY